MMRPGLVLAFAVGLSACRTVPAPAPRPPHGEKGTTVASVAASATGSAPPEAPPEPRGPADLGRDVVGWLDAGETAKVAALFDDGMRQAVPDPAALASLWLGLEAQLGDFRKVVDVVVHDKAGLRFAVVTCRFAAMAMDIHVVFDVEGKLAGLQVHPTENPAAYGPRPQTPTPPFPYEARDVSYANPADGSTIGGTLTLPAGPGPHPAVLLVTGSGAQDRDETIFGHKPFLVLADHLTRKGIAVLRVDDRGVGKSTGAEAGATIETHAGDAEAGLAFLASQPDIDPKRIGLIGHSEGGIIAAVLASRSKAPAFVVSLAGTGLPGADISPMQIEAILAADPAIPATDRQAIVEAQRSIMRAVVADATDAELAAAVEAAMKTTAEHLSGEEKQRKVKAATAGAAATIASPWFRSFVKLDPRKYWEKVTVPVLALVGEKDTQVPADANLKEIGAALSRAKNRDATTKKLGGLNHLFQHAQTGQLEEYAALEETFDPATLELVGTWLRARAHLE